MEKTPELIANVFVGRSPVISDLVKNTPPEETLPEDVELPPTISEESEVLRELKKITLGLQEIKEGQQTLTPTTSVHEAAGFLPPKTMGFARPKEILGDATLAHLAHSQARQRHEVEPEALSAMMMGFQPPAPPSSKFSGCDAQVQVVQGSSIAAQPLQWFIHPLLQSVSGPRPMLTKKYEGGWKSFEKGWNQRLEFLLACNKGVVPPDTLLLRDLQQCLNSADQTLLEFRREQNADLTFHEFFAELQKLYDRDSVAQQRMAWQAVKLPSGELTLYKWLDFLREFQLKKARVDDMTPQEEHTLLMDNLPMSWTRKVMEEEVKRRKGSHLVRMTNAPPKSSMLLQHDLQNALGCQVSRVDTVSNGFVTHCPTESIQQLVLGMQGWTLDGQKIKVSRMEANMSVDDIGAFITEKLEIEHAVQEVNKQHVLATKEVQEISSKPKSPKQNPPHLPLKVEGGLLVVEVLGMVEGQVGKEARPTKAKVPVLQEKGRVTMAKGIFLMPRNKPLKVLQPTMAKVENEKVVSGVDKTGKSVQPVTNPGGELLAKWTISGP